MFALRPTASLFSFAQPRRACLSSLRDAFKDCQEIVEKYDRENLEWIKRLPVDKRAPLIALRALNAETSVIGDIVTQGGSLLRRMRFEWWRNAIDKAFAGETVEHPVITAVQHCARVCSLSKYRLQRMITAKEADQVEHMSPASVKELEDFAESTTSQLHYLQLEAVGVRDKQADHAATHLGKAVGIAGLLRGSNHFLSRGISYFPVDLCAQHGVSTEALYRGEDSEGLRDVVFQLATVAKQHLDDARNLHGEAHTVPAEARAVFLSSVSTDLYLQALEKCNFNVLHPSLRKGGYTPIWYLLQLRLSQYRRVF